MRAGPREISILRPSAIPLIYGGKSPCQKGPWYDQTKFGDDGNSLFNIIDIKKHNHRRRIYDRGFSTKGSLFFSLSGSLQSWTDDVQPQRSTVTSHAFRTKFLPCSRGSTALSRNL